MSLPQTEWDNRTEEAERLHDDLIVAGRGLGKVHPKFFELETWAPCLESSMETRQYAKFVDAMMNRIRFEQSDPVEIRSFVNLIATDSNWKFMEVALPRIPELRDDYLHDQKHFQIALLYQQLKQRINKRSVQECLDSRLSEVWSYEWGLKPDEKQTIWGQMFGPNTAATGPVESESMRRMFSTIITIGYPQTALDEMMANAKAKGTDIQRDHQGLPWDMRLPPSHNKKSKCPSQLHLRGGGYFFTPGGSRLSSGPVWPGRPAGSSRESSNSTEQNPSKGDDSPPSGLLTQMEFDGINDPKQTVPYEYRSSHGKLPTIRTSDEAESFAARRAESPNRPQVPNDAPPAYVKTRTDKDVFRAIQQTEGPLVLLGYFESLPPLPSVNEEEHSEEPLPAVNMSGDASPDEPVPQQPAPIELLEKTAGGGFYKRRVAAKPRFQRSNALKHPKDPYVTGRSNEELVVL